MADLSKLRFNGTDYNVKDASAPLRKFTNYSKTGNLPITSDDTTQTAIGKLEKALDDKISTSAKGTASGVAELDANGKVPSSQLPSYVDDVLEYSAKSSFPTTGETGKIYVDTTTNKTYRWSGSAYVEISESLALGETSSTAYRGDRGKAAYDHSQITNGNPHGTTGANTNLTGYSKGSSKDAVAATDTVNAAIAKHENRINANQSNILYTLETGAANYAPLEGDSKTGSGYFLNATSKGMNVIPSGTTVHIYCEYTKITNTQCSIQLTNVNGDIIRSTTSYAPGAPTNGTISADVTPNVDAYGYNAYYNGASGNTCTLTKVMICPKNVWDAIQKYVPYSVPNYDLTRLEAEDRAGLVECVDGGAKNKVNIVSPTATIGNITFTHNSDGSITVNGTANNTDTFYYLTSTTGNSGQSAVMNVGSSPCILTGCPSGGAGNTYELQLATNSGDYRDRGTGIDIPANSSGSVVIAIRAGYAPSNLKFYPMICTKAAFGVSNKFVPFGNDPFFTVPINHNMIYRGRNLGATLTDAQHTALSSGNFTDLYLGDYWTKSVTIPAGTYTDGGGKEVTVPAQTNITLKAVIADFDTFYAGYASDYAAINTHHAAVIVTGFSNVAWNSTNTTAGGYLNSLINKWLVGSASPAINTWLGSDKVLSHKKLLTNFVYNDSAFEWDISSQKISLLSENQIYGFKLWGNTKPANGSYEPGEAFKQLNVFNHIDANLLFGNNSIWLRDLSYAEWAAILSSGGFVNRTSTSSKWVAPAALILLS